MQSTRGTEYAGVVIFAFKDSSVVVSIPFGLDMASREKRISVGMCSRALVVVKTFWSIPPFLIGRLKKKKMTIVKNKTLSARDASWDNGRGGGRVLIAVLIAR